MKDIITVNKEKSMELYNSALELLKDKNDFDSLLEDRLIDELFSREVVRYLSKLHMLEPNDFKRVDCIMGDDTVKRVSFGYLKRSQDSKPKLTYGII